MVDAIKIGDIVNVEAGKGVFEPFTGEVVGFIDCYVVVSCEGDYLEIARDQIVKQ